MNENETNVAKQSSTVARASILGKALLKEMGIQGTQKTSADNWKDTFCTELDEMVDSFLDFPPNITQEFKDKQFARHLLWRIGDGRKEITKMLVGGSAPSDFDFIWKRLMPFINNQAPDKVSTIDSKYMRLSIDLFKITQDYLVLHESDFNELMTRVVHAINVARYVNSK